MNKWTKLFLSLLLVCSMAMLAACEQDFTKTSYSTLSVMANTYDAVMSSAGDAYKRGLIDEDIKGKVIDVGNVYKGAFDAASLALEAYVKASQEGGADATAKEIATQAIATATSKLADLTALYTRITSGIEGIKTWTQQ